MRINVMSKKFLVILTIKLHKKGFGFDEMIKFLKIRRKNI